MRKPLRCWLGFHKWQKKWEHERSAYFKNCSLCDKWMGTGWPPGLGGD